MVEIYVGADGISWDRIEVTDTVDDTNRAACEAKAEAVAAETERPWAELRHEDGFVLATWGPDGLVVRQPW